MFVLNDDDKWVAPAKNANVYHAGAKVIVLQSGRQSLFEPAIYQYHEEGSQVGTDGAVLVPMHGKIISITVAEKDTVEEGDILFSVEAMKMEHAVLAPCDGIVENLALTVGAQAEAGHVALQVNGDSTP